MHPQHRHAEPAQRGEREVVRVPQQRRRRRRVLLHPRMVAGAARLRPRHLLGPRVGDAAAVAHDVQHPQVDVGVGAQRVRGGRVLAGVDDDLGAADRGGRGVDAGEVVRVEPLAFGPGGQPAGHRVGGDEAGAVHLVVHALYGVDVDVAPAAERHLADLGPERAVVERLAARAQLVVAHAALPQVQHLAQRADAGQLGDDPFEQGRAATAETADETDRRPVAGAGHCLKYGFCARLANAFTDDVSLSVKL